MFLPRNRKNAHFYYKDLKFFSKRFSPLLKIFPGIGGGFVKFLGGNALFLGFAKLVATLRQRMNNRFGWKSVGGLAKTPWMLEPTEVMAAPTPEEEAAKRALKVAFDLHNSGRHEDAEALCRLLLSHIPRDNQLLFLLGMVLQKLGRSAEALKFLETAEQLQPKSARVLNSLGFVHQSLKNQERAVEYYTRAIELGMNAADTYYSMGNACHQLGDIERAAMLFRKAVEIKPLDVASWNNLGKCLNDANRLEESLQTYDRALAIDPSYAMARYGRAVTLLAAGRLREGFREYNQWRTHGIKPRQFPQPEWQGEPIPEQTLFLHAEQGFGDAIMYARFLPEVRKRAAKVILECRPELKTLLTHCGCAEVVIAYGEKIPPFDCFSSVASLPGIFGTVLDTIPQGVPYLKVSATELLPPAQGGQLKVGVVWAGNPLHHNDAARSMRLEEFAPILQVPGVAFYSLQLPVPARDETSFRSLENVVDVSGRFKGFLETAAIVSQLDLVIAVDTAMAHLAGALGRPVWTLLPFAPDWRWMLEREDTPWYPNMRLFRQKQRGQWQPVVAGVVEELGRLTAGNAKEIPEPNPPLTTEEQSALDQLTDVDLEIIDAAILANSSHRWLKVARVVTSTEKALKDRYPKLSYVFYSLRLIELEEEGRLESKGNLEYIRFSEVRIPGK